MGETNATELPEPILFLAEKPFISMEGEGSVVGQPTMFLRLQGCNLRCNFCDTSHSRHIPTIEDTRKLSEPKPFVPIRGAYRVPYDQWKELLKPGEDIIHPSSPLASFPGYKGRITITGGEPLYQKANPYLLDFLIEYTRFIADAKAECKAHRGQIEQPLIHIITNGSQPLPECFTVNTAVKYLITVSPKIRRFKLAAPGDEYDAPEYLYINPVLREQLFQFSLYHSDDFRSELLITVPRYWTVEHSDEREDLMKKIEEFCSPSSDTLSSGHSPWGQYLSKRIGREPDIFLSPVFTESIGYGGPIQKAEGGHGALFALGEIASEIGNNCRISLQTHKLLGFQ